MWLGDFVARDGVRDGVVDNNVYVSLDFLLLLECFGADLRVRVPGEVVGDVRLSWSVHHLEVKLREPERPALDARRWPRCGVAVDELDGTVVRDQQKLLAEQIQPVSFAPPHRRERLLFTLAVAALHVGEQS